MHESAWNFFCRFQNEVHYIEPLIQERDAPSEKGLPLLLKHQCIFCRFILLWTKGLRREHKQNFKGIIFQKEQNINSLSKRNLTRHNIK